MKLFCLVHAGGDSRYFDKFIAYTENKNIDIVQDDFKISEEDIIKNKEVNAYGAVSVAIVGSILIIAGLIISVILKLT